MLPPVQFLKPKQVEGLMRPSAPVFEILKHPQPLQELKRPMLQHLDRVRMCCEAMTAQCIACAKGLQVEDLCQRAPHIPGCHGLMVPPGIPAMAKPGTPSLPLNEMVKEAVKAAGGSSDAAEFAGDVEQYAEAHPEALENAKNKVKGLSKMLSHRHNSQRVHAKAAPAAPLPTVDGSMAVPPMSVALEEPDLGSRWFENPWIIAGMATAAAALCTGIAVGVLCLAQIQRVQIAREPLLAGASMQTSLSDATMPQDM